jgi:hypothetical protein
MKDSKFKSMAIIAVIAGSLLLIGIISAGALGYYLYKQSFVTCQNCPVPSPTPVITPTRTPSPVSPPQTR